MAGMRVHELAKEFGISSKDMLKRLQDMKIPAKSHASVLNDAYVQKVRDNMAPEIKEQAGELDDKEARELAEKKAAEAKEKAEKEAARRAVVEKERALRERERERRAATKESKESDKEEASDRSQAPSTIKTHQFDKLVSQIASEQARVAREEQERRERAKQERDNRERARLEAERARARKRVEAAAREVAKKQAVEQSLAASRGGKRHHTSAPAQEASQHKAPKTIPTHTSAFASLLDQIDHEQKRMETQKAESKASGKKGRKNHNKKPSHTYEPDVPELEGNESAASGEDRYAQMAVQAEKLQRDKVLSEARAAVAAASHASGEGRRRKRKEKREAEKREHVKRQAIEHGIDPNLVLDDSVVEVPESVTVGKFAELLGVSSADVVKRLFLLGSPLTMTQSMSDELVELIADDMGRKVRIVSPEEEFAVVYHDSDEDLKPRPPVVTVMGHVDHGKTSLLDAIRNTGVAEGEAGGITQTIGASVVHINGRQITFIDTPGHEAFTAMRARGAQVTDVIVLVVAADDGVMPQTIEAINHAKAAKVPIVVAVNKIDKPGVNAERVRQELVEYGIVPEEWGGENMFVDVSAKKRLHIDDLLETILLQADVLELKANPDALASGFVIESKLDKGRGPVATVLVQRGTMHPGDTVVAGTSYGRVRALVDPRGNHVNDAKPADPVEILGLDSVPTAGDEFRVFEDERDARKLAEERSLRERLKAQETKKHMSLDDLFSKIEEGKQTDLNLVIKADVQGSIEALVDALGKMDQSEVKINVVHSAVGGITETDVTLAAASDAIIIGFNVRPTGKSRATAEREKVDIRLYRVIYQAIEDINAARVGLLSPDIVEEDTGIAEVRELFRVPKVGVIAGCYITEGEIDRDNKVRIVRDGTVVYEGSIASLRRFKDDVKTVQRGYECGIGIDGFQDIKVGDTIEGYRTVEVERTE